ncbi:flagellar motor protein [Rutstroemia sp. NJR-2017a BVV2]|nr:flagellar motor protein [Rutstroemia sp. NJR-2017a BVV2]
MILTVMATTNPPNATNPPNPPNPPKSSSKLPTPISRRKSSSSASIVSSITSATPSSQTKRTTLPPLTAGQRAAQASRHAQCTHVTTTRLYTKEFRCAICYREGSFGWLYRCTQDRELMLDEHMEKGYPEQEKLDELCDIFPTPPSPRKRSPLARSSKLSFLDEISPEQLKTYTPAQIQLVLNQRSQLLEILNPAVEPNDLKLPTTPSSNSARFSFNPFIRNSITPLSPDTDPMPPPTPPAKYKSRKSSSTRSPWLPAKGYECQFKCCHSCRPTLLDRSYLSLNGIVNGDVPATAITGFSFNLEKSRPVAKASIVSNLGFRPVPLPRPVTQSSTQSRRDEQLFARRRLRYTSADTLGLGILSNDSPLISASASSSSTSLSSSSSSPPESPSSPPESPSSPPESPSTPPKEPLVETITAPDSQPEQKLLSASPSPILPHAPHPTPLRTPSDSPLLLSSPFRNESPTSTPLPEQTPSEISLPAIPLTPTGMERRESFGQYFDPQPLEVEDGVAVMEEGVGLHVPDVLITQY